MERREDGREAAGGQTSPVWSFTEWDPLEEVIVGRVEGACFPSWRVINERTVGPGEWDEIEARVGRPGGPYPAAMVEAAQRCVEGFIHVLEAEGVVVRRPDILDHGRSFSSPDWASSTGFCVANPRDPFLVVGDEIIETPMADRARYFEGMAYRRLFTEYLRGGARWSAAPRPRLSDALFDREPAAPDGPMRFVTTEVEPVFDAADCVRCGRDLFIQRSHVTNELGILWLQRHLGDRHRVHVVEHRNPEAIHIDTTFMPLAPGKVLVSPEYMDVRRLPAALSRWDVLVAPEPVPTVDDPLGVVSRWGSINVLMLDEERIVVERRQEPLIRSLKAWGFKPVPLSFEAWLPFMGSLHCATLDVRRRGALQSYL
jgi:glycine amidinotransferase